LGIWKHVFRKALDPASAIYLSDYLIHLLVVDAAFRGWMTLCRKTCLADWVNSEYAKSFA